FFSPILPPPLRPTLFPYTTLFRSSPGSTVLFSPDRDRLGRESETKFAGEPGCTGTLRCEPEPAAPSFRCPLPCRSLPAPVRPSQDRKSTRLNSSHVAISYAVFCLK